MFWFETVEGALVNPEHVTSIGIRVLTADAQSMAPTSWAVMAYGVGGQTMYQLSAARDSFPDAQADLTGWRQQLDAAASGGAR